MGTYECDDGNLKDGDGCSKECKIEEGFHCQGGGTNTKDICKDIKSPILSINPYKNRDFDFYFDLSENVQIIINQEPKTFMDLTITGKLKSYLFDYEVQFERARKINRELLSEINQGENDLFESIIITLIPLSSIRKDDVIFYIY